MTVDQVRKVQQASPFKPYKLCLADGRSFEVRHPELVLITPGGRTVVLAVSDDAVTIIDLLLVTSIDIVDGSATET